MSKKLYLDDSYRRSFEAEITGSSRGEAGWEVTLKETYFYPESGGQPADRGNIGHVPVLDVQLRGDEVVHILAEEPPASPTPAEIDWRRRYDHMQQHTGQHLLTAALIKLYDADTVGFHLGAHVSTIDVTMPGLSAERRRQAEELCNEWIVSSLPVMVEYVSVEEFNTIELRKKALPDEIDGPVRLLRIGDVDIAHCGGTHLRSTSELQVLKIIGSEKVRDTTRISFLAGRRAVNDYSSKHDMLNSMAADLTCAIDDLPAKVSRLYTEAKESRKQLKKMRREMIAGMASREAEAAVEAGSYRVLARRYDGWEADELKTLAGEITSAEPNILLCAGGGDPGKGIVVLAAGKSFPGNLGETIKLLLPLFNGKGGGRGNFAQAAGDFASLDAVIAEAETLLREIGETS